MNTVLHNNQPDEVKNFMQYVFENDRRIYAYIFVLVQNQADADDLFQDTLTIMWEKYETFQQGSDFGAWGIGIAYNLVRNYRRKKARSRVKLEEDIEQLIETEAKQILSNLDHRIEALQSCFPKLNQLDQTILKLKFENNISVKNIAEKIGSTTNIIYSKLARANDILLRCIKRALMEKELQWKTPPK